MRIRIPLIVLMLASGVAITTGTHAASYKWTDSEGNVHYSQTPPSGAEAEKIAPPPKVAPGEQPKTDDAEPADDGTQPPSSEGEPNPEHQAEVYRKNCEIANKNMKAYTTSRRIQTSGGEVIRMSDEMRKEKINEAQQAIEKYCK